MLRELKMQKKVNC